MRLSSLPPIEKIENMSTKIIDFTNRSIIALHEIIYFTKKMSPWTDANLCQWESMMV